MLKNNIFKRLVASRGADRTSAAIESTTLKPNWAQISRSFLCSGRILNFKFNRTQRAYGQHEGRQASEGDGTDEIASNTITAPYTQALLKATMQEQSRTAAGS